jgi:hypothetical protein
MELMTAMRPAARRKNDRSALLADSRAPARGELVEVLIDAHDIREILGRHGVAG